MLCREESGRCHFWHPIAHHVCCKAFDMASFGCWRSGDGCGLGEAKNPGPLRVGGAFTPHQLYNKENVVIEWGDGIGIWAGTETSHTLDAMHVSQSRFRKAAMSSLWSPPVKKHT